MQIPIEKYELALLPKSDTFLRMLLLHWINIYNDNCLKLKARYVLMWLADKLRAVRKVILWHFESHLSKVAQLNWLILCWI